jgi:hypothetical protein
LESEVIIKEILKNMKLEKERINKKFKSDMYSIDECRNEYDECNKCIEIVLKVVENNYSKDYMNKIIKECLLNR